MTTSNLNTPMSLGTAPIGKLLLQYSVPAVIASVATSLYNIIDSIFIGRGVGTMALSGLAITFPLMNLVIAFCVVIAVGGSTISSILLGQKNIQRAKDVINNVLILSIIHAIVFGGITLLFLDEILYFFGATDTTIPYAREFMQVILYGTPISYVFIVLNNLMRATGYPKKAMLSALLSVLVNIILAPIYIFALDWGIKGAAFATICGQSIALIWVLIHFCKKSSFVHFSIENNLIVPTLIKRMYAIGLSPFLMNVCACVVVVFINNALLETGKEYGATVLEKYGNLTVEDFGDLAVGAYGIVNRTAMLFVMIVFGITQGMQPILGFNFGANKWDRVKRTLNIGLIIGLIITTIGFIVGEIFPREISYLYNDNEILVDLSCNGFRISYIFIAVVGGQIVIQNFFQSIGRPGISIFLSLTRQLLFLVPFLVILPHFYGLDGVWWSLAISDLLAFLVAAITLYILMKRREKTI